MKNMKSLLQTVIVVFLLSAAAFAQATGSLHGIITEHRGYVMYGLTAFARNRASGEARKAVTDDKANFPFGSMPPGDYLLYADCKNVERIFGNASIEGGKSGEVELIAMATRPTGNAAV